MGKPPDHEPLAWRNRARILCIFRRIGAWPFAATSRRRRHPRDRQRLRWPPDQTCDRLVDSANARGGRENISAILLRYV